MKTTRILWAAAILAAFAVSQTTPARGWTLDRLNPFHKNEAKAKPADRTVNMPSPLQKLNTGTKAFFSNIRNTLTPKKSATRKSPLKPRIPWVRNPKPQHKSPSKKAPRWNPFFRQEEPKPPRTLDDWMSLESPKP